MGEPVDLNITSRNMDLHHILNIMDFGRSSEVLERCAESGPAGGDGLAGVEFGVVEETERRVEGDEGFGVGAETFCGCGEVAAVRFLSAVLRADQRAEMEVGEGAEERGAS